MSDPLPHRKPSGNTREAGAHPSGLDTRSPDAESGEPIPARLSNDDALRLIDGLRRHSSRAHES